jgi:hypothetical protein
MADRKEPTRLLFRVCPNEMTASGKARGEGGWSSPPS